MAQPRQWKGSVREEGRERGEAELVALVLLLPLGKCD